METILLIVFALGYTAIVFEHRFNVNKAAPALCTGVICWAVIAIIASKNIDRTLGELGHDIGSIAGILIFLIGAMTIVEVIDRHDGFRIVTDKITTKNKRKLLWLVAILTFFLSSILDNLTTTIVMVSLLAKLMASRNDRLIFASIIIVAANTGGAWTPIGDVTTTMLWMKGHISAGATITTIFLPSVICLLIPLIAFTFTLKGEVQPPAAPPRKDDKHKLPKRLQMSVLLIGVGILLAVPVFKAVTNLPPYMGIVLGVGILWIYTELVYRKNMKILKSKYSVSKALRYVDMTTIMFFLGILLSVGALQSAGVLTQVADWLDKTIGNQSIVVVIIGLVSAVVDNVPLVAAAQGMYSHPIDDFFWLFLTYAAGTGGSILVIGSAAGVAAMGMEKIDFIWYLRKVSFWVLIGYLVGALVFIGCFQMLMG